MTVGQAIPVQRLCGTQSPKGATSLPGAAAGRICTLHSIEGLHCPSRARTLHRQIGQPAPRSEVRCLARSSPMDRRIPQELALMEARHRASSSCCFSDALSVSFSNATHVRLTTSWGCLLPVLCSTFLKRWAMPGGRPLPSAAQGRDLLPNSHPLPFSSAAGLRRASRAGSAYHPQQAMLPPHARATPGRPGKLQRGRFRKAVASLFPASAGRPRARPREATQRVPGRRGGHGAGLGGRGGGGGAEWRPRSRPLHWRVCGSAATGAGLAPALGNPPEGAWQGWGSGPKGPGVTGTCGRASSHPHPDPLLKYLLPSCRT